MRRICTHPMIEGPDEEDAWNKCDCEEVTIEGDNARSRRKKLREK